MMLAGDVPSSGKGGNARGKAQAQTPKVAARKPANDMDQLNSLVGSIAGQKQRSLVPTPNTRK